MSLRPKFGSSFIIAVAAKVSHFMPKYMPKLGRSSGIYELAAKNGCVSCNVGEGILCLKMEAFRKNLPFGFIGNQYTMTCGEEAIPSFCYFLLRSFLAPCLRTEA